MFNLSLSIHFGVLLSSSSFAAFSLTNAAAAPIEASLAAVGPQIEASLTASGSQSLHVFFGFGAFTTG